MIDFTLYLEHESHARLSQPNTAQYSDHGRGSAGETALRASKNDSDEVRIEFHQAGEAAAETLYGSLASGN